MSGVIRFDRDQAQVLAQGKPLALNALVEPLAKAIEQPIKDLV